MAKQTGLGDNLYVGGYNLSGDIGSLSSITGSVTALDVTSIDRIAFERIGGKRDGWIDFVAYFNTTAGRAHPILSALPLTDVGVMYCRGTTLGNASACLVAKQLNYDGSRDTAGNFTFKTQAQSNGFGLEWGNLLTAGQRTDTAATLGTGVDTVASASFGFQAYLQVFSFAGTDVTVKLQDSADNVVFTDIASGGFTQITGITPQTQRIAVGGTATVRQYVRAVTVTTGGFTSLVFAVNLVKNTLAVVF